MKFFREKLVKFSGEIFSEIFRVFNENFSEILGKF